MFQENGNGLVGDTKALSENIKLADVSLKTFAGNLRTSITNVQQVINGAAEINTKAANTVRTTLGQTRIVSNQVQRVVAQAAKTTELIGVDASKNLELFGALNESMQRNTFFTDQQISRFQLLGSMANMTSAQLAEMATSFDTLGYTTDQTLDMMSDMTDEARAYGVNVSAFMGEVNKNLKLMVTYNFKDGVEGLSKMVAQAQALRIDMSKTVSFADELMSPDKAIETAAGFQMLGGAVGALGDPFQLLHMAQTDMEGLQTSLVDMAGASVDFNKETGEFNIPVTEMYRLREAASLAGQSYQEFSEMAINAAQRTEKLKLLDGFNTVPEEQKELIASLGKIGANGTMEITMPDGSIKKIGEGFNELVASDYGELQSMLDVNNMSELDVAKQSMGFLNEIQAAQNTLVKLTTLNLVQSGGFETFGENISKVQSLLTESFLARESEVALPESVTTTFGTLATQLKLDKTDADEMANAIVDGLNKFSEAVDSKLVPALENIDYGTLIIDPLKNGWNNLTNALKDIPFLEIIGNTVNVSSGRFDRSNEDNTVNVTSDDRFDRTNNNTTEVSDRFDRSNMAVNNIETSSLNVNSTDNTPVQLAVNGQVNLNIEGIPTNSPMTKEELATLLVNNPDAMFKIKSQLENRLGTLTEFNMGGGYG